MKKFDPSAAAVVKPPVEMLQINNFRIHGELGLRAVKVARKYGMGYAKFVTLCVQFALDNMEDENERDS